MVSIKKNLIRLFFLGSSAGIFAHGLIENPPSRNWICGAVTRPDEVDQGTAKHPACSTAFAVNPLAAYDYMSVVTHSLGRAVVAPLPKNVCGFDGEFWKGAETPWDAPMAWPATPMSAGPQSFTWNITWGPHFDDTFEFRYWITKPGFVFSPAKALTWDDFETEAFCVAGYDDKNPSANPDVSADKAKSHFITRCRIPERTGHHVIYAEWGRTEPTIERFHGCVDATFNTASIGTPSVTGTRSGKSVLPLKRQTDLLGRSPVSGARTHFPNR